MNVYMRWMFPPLRNLTMGAKYRALLFSKLTRQKNLRKIKTREVAERQLSNTEIIPPHTVLQIFSTDTYIHREIWRWAKFDIFSSTKGERIRVWLQWLGPFYGKYLKGYHWIQIQSGHWIRMRIHIRIRIHIRNPYPDPGGQKWPTKRCKSRKNLEISWFEVLDVLFWELKASFVNRTSFMEA